MAMQSDFQELCKDIYRRVSETMSNLSNDYNFIIGLPDSLECYLDEPKKYKNVRDDITRIFNYILDEIIKKEFIKKYKITLAIGSSIKNYLKLNKLGNLRLIRDLYEDDLIIEQKIREKKLRAQNVVENREDLKVSFPDITTDFIESQLCDLLGDRAERVEAEQSEAEGVKEEEMIPEESEVIVSEDKKTIAPVGHMPPGYKGAMDVDIIDDSFLPQQHPLKIQNTEEKVELNKIDIKSFLQKKDDNKSFIKENEIDE